MIAWQLAFSGDEPCMIRGIFFAIISLSALATETFAQALNQNFESIAVNSLPGGWTARGGSARDVYQIEAEQGGNRYLAARSRGSDVQLGIEVNAQPEQQPILSWRWRVLELPRQADERKVATMDSAAAVYAVFGSRLFPRVIKYVWSSSVPAGSVFKHPRSNRVAIVVVASGEQQLGRWQTVVRDLHQDFQQIFESAPGGLIAIGVKTDSDSTSGSARADYDDLALGPRSTPQPPKEKR